MSNYSEREAELRSLDMDTQSREQEEQEFINKK